MDTFTPDPHPGRCVSYRYHWQDGTVRCLDYEGHKGACTFPQPAPKPKSLTSQTWSQKPPEPWVSPLDASTPGQENP